MLLSLLLGLTMLGSEAFAVTIESHSCTQQSGNTMRYDCNVVLSGAGNVRFGTRQTAVGGAWNWSDWHAGVDIDQVLYNFEPDKAYEYIVFEAGGDGSSATSLGTPSLPTDLDDLKLSITRNTGTKSNYVLFDTPDLRACLPTVSST
jgi:hypothetical protein